MDAFLKPLTELFNPPWNYILGLGFLAILLAPRLTELYREYVDVRMGRRNLECEKLNLEILKLREELKNLGVLEKLPELKEGVREIMTAVQPGLPKPTPLPEAAAERAAPQRPGRFRVWCTRHPRLARNLMLLTQVASAFLMVVFALDMVIVPILFWSQEKMGPLPSILFALIYGAFAWVSYKGFVASRSIRKELNDR